MRSQIAAAAALVGAAVAVPHEYKYNTPSPVDVVYETDVATIYSCPPEVTNCPVGRPAGYSTPAAPVYTPTETPCEESTAAAVYSTPAAVYSTPAAVYSTPVAEVSTPCEETVSVYSTPAAVYSTPAAVYSSPAPSAPATYVICSTELITVTSCAAYVTNCPADHTAVYTSLIPYTTTTCEESEAATLSSYWIPYTQVVSTPVVYSTPAAAYSTPCEETATEATYVAPPVTAPYPTGTAVVTYPVGSGTAYPTGTGVPTTPYPPTFTGAASGVKAGLSVAGLGAIAAFFL